MLSRDLDYFIGIAENGSLRRTAALAGVSQPAVTKGLRRLESELDLVLVERSRSGAVLSESGRAFLGRARWLRREMEVALQHASDLRASAQGLVRVGVTPALVEPVFRPASRRLMAQRPAASFRVQIGLTDELFPALWRGDLDIVLSGIPESPAVNLHITELGQNELRVVAREDHPLFRKRRLKLADLTREEWMLPHRDVLSRDWLEGVFSVRGLPLPTVRIEFTPNHDALLPMVLETDLLSVAGEAVYRRLAPAGLRTIEIDELCWRRPIAALTRADAKPTLIAARFVELLQEVTAH